MRQIGIAYNTLITDGLAYMSVIMWGVAWVFGALLAGHIAYNKGRSQMLYIMIGLVLTPVVALLMIICSKSDQAALQEREIKAGKSKRCPKCAEVVLKAATVCKHCGCSF